MHIVLNSFGTSLQRENELFAVVHKDGKKIVEPKKVKSISISRGARISSDAVLLAIENESQIAGMQQKIKENEKQQGDGAEPEGKDITLTGDLLAELRKRLNPNYRPRSAKQVYVPGELERIIPHVEARFTELGLKIKAVENINYGKKIIVETGLRWAEVNIFFGKKGYSVVKTPKNGSNPELADIVYRIIMEILND